MNIQRGALMKKVLYRSSGNTPWYFVWWSYQPIPIRKCNKKWWDSFLHMSLGCVAHRIQQPIPKRRILYFPVFIRFQTLILVKLGLSEKHTKFEKIFLMLWTFEVFKSLCLEGLMSCLKWKTLVGISYNCELWQANVTW